MSKVIFVEDTIIAVSKRYPTATNKLKRPLIVYEGKTRSFLRTIPQFIKDIEDSWLGTFPLPQDEKRHIEVLSNPALPKLMQKLIGGTVSAHIEEWNAGDGYIVNEFSSVLKDSTHPMFNKGVKAGDTLKHEAAGFRVVNGSDDTKLGFCMLAKADKWNEIEEVAEVTAAQRAADKLGSTFNINTFVTPEERMREVPEPTHEEQIAALEAMIEHGTAGQRRKAKADLDKLTANQE